MRYFGIARKTAAILANLSLFLNSFLPFLVAIQPVYANDPEVVAPAIVENTPTPEPSNIATPTPNEPTPTEPVLALSPTPEISPTVTPTPLVTPENTPTITPTIEPTPESTPTATPTNTPTLSPTPSSDNQPASQENNQNNNSGPSPTAQLTPTPSVEPTPTVAPVIEQNCLTEGESIKDTTEFDWNYDQEKDLYETKEKVKLGVKYIFPQDNNVTVTFKCLPTNESLLSTLKIKRVKTSDLNLPDSATNVGEYAYDITTDMMDGIFKYDITLPKTSDNNAGIAYIEKSIDAAKLGVSDSEIKSVSDTEQQSDKVIGKDINHFTLFIVTNGTKLSVSGSFNGVSQVTVSPNTSIEVNLTVERSGGTIGHPERNDWGSTSWKIGNNSWICENHTDYNLFDGTNSESFKITAPLTVGTYDVSFRAHRDNDCGDTGISNTFTLTDGIIVNNTGSLINPPILNNNPSDTYALNSVTGSWTSISNGSGYQGIGTTEIRWGNPSGAQKSGLRFTNSGAQSFNSGNTFYLGMLTHMNWGTYAGTAADGATLQITLNFNRPNIPNPVFTYDFDIEETLNSSGSCQPYQISNTPCDDKITFPTSYGTQVVTIGDIQYTLVIDGFVNAYPSGTAVPAFITEEQKENSAFLVGHLSSVLVERPAISIIKTTNDQDITSTPGPYLSTGDTVNWKYNIQNIGNVDLTNVTVTDNPAVVINCNGQTTLASGAQMICTASGTVTAGQFSNTATVTGTYSTGTVTASDTSWYFGTTCGDHVIEGSEQCDGGACCDNTCHFASSGSVCRTANGSCDTAEVCSGTSATCPTDSFKPVGTSCSDGLFCNGNEQCNGAGSCLSGNVVDCSANNITGINSCDNDPDNNPFTKDTRDSFNSVCSEATQSCTVGDSTIFHQVPTVGTCGVECNSDSNCLSSEKVCNIGTHQCVNSCGNNIKESWEECDGTNGVGEHQKCNSQCKLEHVPYCGDGNTDAGETCDDGVNNGKYGYCNLTCNGRSLHCGDDIVTPPEECDGSEPASCLTDLGYFGTKSCDNSTCGWGNCLTTKKCGDGVVNGLLEICDDGNNNGKYGYCNSTCTAMGEFCGDKTINGDEQCDGSAPEHYSCTSQCKLEYIPYCGDGIKNLDTEECDDGDTNNTNLCSNSCKVNHQKITLCHATPVETATNGWNTQTIDDDGIEGEAHDSNHGADIIPAFSYYKNGVLINYPGKNLTNTFFGFTGQQILDNGCQISSILKIIKTVDNTGGGIKSATDFKFSLNGGSYTNFGIGGSNTFTLNIGDTYSVIENPEFSSTYSVSPNNCSGTIDSTQETCTITNTYIPYCGDGYKYGSEQCDDGNTDNTDSCTNSCYNATCGDGLIWAGKETCDNGASNKTTCSTTYGSVGSCSYCDATLCTIKTINNPRCGDGIVDSAFGEQCDDANLVNTDTCTNTCKSAKCGDGFLQFGEQCDDGNTNNNDNCSSTCQLEYGSVKITKEVVPDDSSVWNFVLSGNGQTYPVTNLGDGDSYTITNVLPGGYNLSEFTSPSYFTQVTCDNDGPYQQNGYLLTIRPNQTNNCTFTNTKINPVINIVKSSTTTSITSVGQTVPYTFEITNAGNQILTGITVTDTKCNTTPVYQSGDTNSDSKLDLSEKWIYSCNHTVTQLEIDNGGNLTNIVTADSNESDPDTDTKNISITQDPKFTVTKLADVSSVDNAGDVINYTVTVTNTGNQTLTGVSVNDPLLSNLDCDPNTFGYQHTGLSINVGAHLTCVGSYTVAQTDIDNYGGGDGDIDNTVTADTNQTGPQTADKSVLINGSITIIKTDNLNSGADFTFNYTIGSSAPTNFVLDDDNDSDNTYLDRIKFFNLSPNAYSIGESSTPGWSSAMVQCTSNYSLDGYQQYTPSLGTISTDLRQGENLICTFSNTRDTGSLTVNKIIDLDGDLTTTDDQTPGANWQFDVDGNSSNTDDPSADYTDINGTKVFSNLRTGLYNIIETKQTGYDLISANCGERNGTFDTIDSVDNASVNKDTNTVCIFYNTPNSTIRGYKWSDLNGDGLHNDGESLLSGWTINLYRALDAGGYESTPFRSTTTSSESNTFGWYWFEHLLPGSYQVCEVPQNGWRQISPINSGCHLINLPNQSSGSFNADDPELPTYNFGNQQLAVVNVTKFSDFNGNGQQDSGESNLSNWTINLSGQTSVVTNINGVASFANLIPGSYNLSENLQTGWRQTNIICDGDEGTDNDNSHQINLIAGQILTCKIANQQLSNLTVYKFNDANGNGQKDEGETNLSNWTINLTNQTSQNTDENGQTVFDNLVPGNYDLSENVQSENGWKQTNIYCEDSGNGVKITASGEAYGHHGSCSGGWNGYNAATLAQWACEVKGYTNLVSYGAEKYCTEFNACNLFWSRGSVQYNWGNGTGWCTGVLGVTDIVCSNSSGSGDYYNDGYVSGNHLTINPGQNKVCYIGNQRLAPKANISKSNNSGGAELTPGNSVDYTINVGISDNNINNLKVTDLLSNGFKYKVGSYKVYKNNVDVTSQVGEPQYHSPGVWDLTSLGELTHQPTPSNWFTPPIFLPINNQVNMPI